MSRPLNLVLAELRGLTESDFDESSADAHGIQRLYQLCRELEAWNDADAAAPVMFDVMERLGHCELGNPGSLVHTLERWEGRYETYLLESLARKPSPLAVWMVNRILNANPANPEMWLAQLRAVGTHPLASEQAREGAKRYLKHQGVGSSARDTGSDHRG